MKLISAVSLMVLLVGAAGCEHYGGGALVVPQVTILPAELGSTGDAGGAAEPATDTASSAGVGIFQGRVVLSGTAPVLPLLISAGANVKDKEVCAAVDQPDERIVVTADGGVANVFVYLGKAPKGGQPAEAAGDAIIFDQKNCRFLPHCLVVPVGRTVKILSDDPVAHNTHTYPKKNDSINSGVGANDREGKLTFAYRRAESVPLAVTCDYHGWMKAWHLPVDHPYAAVTDAEGRFTIPDLPAGTHEFIVWHESIQGNFVERKLKVSIRAGETSEMNIELPAAKLSL